MTAPAGSTRSPGAFIAILACLFGVIVTSIVQPATGSDDPGRSSRAQGALDDLTGPGGVGGSSGATAAEAATSDTSPSGASGSSDTPAAPGESGNDAAGTATAADPGASAPGGRSRADAATGETIKIGFAVADAGALESYAGIGDTEGHLRSVLAGWQEAGLVPVHGRKIEPVVRTFSLLSVEEQRAACVGFAQDDGVFLVMAPLVFIAGAECLAREFQIPVLASAGAIPGEDWFARTHPYAFYTNMSETRVGENFIHWAHDNGLLRGKRIGLNYSDDPAVGQTVQRAIKGPLSELGYEVALDFPSPDGSEGLAVQRFQAARVDLAIVMGANETGPRAANFSRAAQVQRYKPGYIVSEFLGTNGLAPGFADSFDPDQFDGVLAMSYYRRAEDGRFGNPPIPRAGVECERQYESFSGRQIDRFENSNEWDALQHACDQGRAVITALRATGPELTALNFTTAMETAVQDQESGEVANISFSPTKHDGANEVKTMRWSRDCTCWLHAANFRALYVN